MEKASQFLRHRPADRQVPFWKGTAEYLCEAYLPEVRKEGAQLLPVQTQRSSLDYPTGQSYQGYSYSNISEFTGHEGLNLQGEVYAYLPHWLN